MKLLFTLSICIFINRFSYCQPGTKVKELYRDRYTVDGGNYGHPYSTFGLHNNKTIFQTIESIKVRINTEKNLPDSLSKAIFLAYKQVYDNALSPRPTDDGMPNTGISGLARWAKSNAFVMLVGLNGNGDTLSLAHGIVVRIGF